MCFFVITCMVTEVRHRVERPRITGLQTRKWKRNRESDLLATVEPDVPDSKERVRTHVPVMAGRCFRRSTGPLRNERVVKGGSVQSARKNASTEQLLLAARASARERSVPGYIRSTKGIVGACS